MGNLVLRKYLITDLFLLSLLFCGCSTTTNKKVDFGFDRDYFLALQDLQQNKENDARTKLKRCVKNGTYYCAKKSAELLTTFGSVVERSEACNFFVEKYDDPETLLKAVEFFYSTNEFGRVIQLTQNCKLDNEHNKLIRLRLQALKEVNAQSLKKETYDWFTLRRISEEHYKFYRDFVEISDSFETQELEIQEFLINYRIEAYKRNYTYTFNNSQRLLEIFTLETKYCLPQLISDLGKTYLYGSAEYVKNANLLKQLAQDFEGTSSEYYFWFYAGRLFDKAGVYYSSSQSCFKNAMQSKCTITQKDDALWYLLNSQKNYSLDNLLDSIKNYSKEWDNPEYFDDFLANLVTALLASGKWDAMGSLYKCLDGYASNEAVSQMAYIYARLCQKKLAIGSAQDVEQAFRRALNCGSAVYYKIMAAYNLKITGKELEALLCESPKEKITQIDENAQILLNGYMVFGFPELIYPNYLEFYKNGISTELSLKIAEFLQKCGENNNSYYPQSLRIASRTNLNCTRDMTRNELSLLFPKDYSHTIDTTCEKYKVDKEVMYALIRSESFFDSGIFSSADAKGLTQLVDATANDIARELKVSDYSLTDADTNIEFGTYYLAKLRRLFDNSYLNAFYSYNAGRARVLRWLDSTAIGFGKKTNMESDLFLETIPIAETREYGRKLVSATAMYYWIYNSHCEDLNFLDELFFE